MHKPSIISILLWSITFAARAQSPNEIVERYFQAIGGKEKVSDLLGVRSKLVIYQCYPTPDTSFVEVSEKLPHYHYSRVEKNHLLNTEVFANETGEVFQFYQPYPWKVDKEQKRVIALYAQEILTLHNADQFKIAKNSSLIDSSHFILQIKGRSKKEAVSYYFDRHSGLLAKQTSPFNLVLFKNYKSVGELLVPFSIETYTSNGKTLVSKSEIQNIAFNPVMSDSIFYRKVLSGNLRRDSAATKIQFLFLDPVVQDKAVDQLLEQFKGENILIDLWATWCAPCKNEFKHYDAAFYSFLASKNIKMLFLSIDKPSKEKHWREDIEIFTLNGYHALVGSSLHKSIKKQFYEDQQMFIPRYILVGNDGKILSVDVPRPSSGMFQQTLSTLLPN